MSETLSSPASLLADGIDRAAAILIENAAEATLLLALALVLVRWLPTLRVHGRLRLLAAALAGVVLLPLFALALPSRPLELLPRPFVEGEPYAPMLEASSPREQDERGETIVSVTPSTRHTPSSAAPRSRAASSIGSLASPAMPPGAPRATVGSGSAVRLDLPPLLLLLWLTGFAVALLRQRAAHRSLRRLERESRVEVSPEWLRALTDAARRLGVTVPVQLLVSDRVTSPITWGDRYPVVMLPAGCEQWDDERRRVVLDHELAHVRRHDWRTRLVGRLVCACYWFHPLAWLTLRTLIAEQERACDEEVVRLGTRPSRYARHLLALARHDRTDPLRTLAALPMARRSQLETRLMSLLEPRSSRPGRFAAPLALVLIVGLTPVLGALEPWSSGSEETRPVAPTPPTPPDSAPAPPSSTPLPRLAAPLAAPSAPVALPSTPLLSAPLSQAPSPSALPSPPEGLAPSASPLRPSPPALPARPATTAPAAPVTQPAPPAPPALPEALSELEESAGEMRRLDRRLEPFERQLEQIEREMEPAEERLRAIESELEPFEQRLAAVEQELEPWEARIEQAEAGIEPVEERLRATEQELEPYERRLQELEAELEPYELRLAEAERELEAGEARRSEVEERMLAAAAEVEEAARRLEQAEAGERDELLARLRELEAGLEPHRREMEQLHREMAPALERMSAIHDEMQPVFEHMRAIHEEMRPVHERLAAMHEEMRPIHEQASQIHRQMEPVHARIGEVHREMQPVLERIADTHRSMEPLHRRIAEVHREMEPIHREVAAVHERIEADLDRVVLALLHEELGPLGVPDAVLAAAAGDVRRVIDVRVEGDRLWLRGSLPEVKTRLLDSLSSRGFGSAQLETACERAARRLVALEVTLD